MSAFELDRLWRGSVRVREGDRVVTIEAEGHLNVPGSPGYVVYGGSISNWDPPHERELIGEEQKSEILRFVVACLQSRGMRVSVE